MFPAPTLFPMRPVAAIVATVLCSAPLVARAVEPFVIQDIRVEGLQRTDPGTVFGALPFRIGDTYTDEKGSVALRALFATGLFKDVRIEIEGRVAVVVVDERPVIANVTFVGLKEFDKDQLVKSLKDAGIGEGLPFDRAIVDRAEQEIKRQYLARSLYGAEVVTTVTPIERNRVEIRGRKGLFHQYLGLIGEDLEYSVGLRELDSLASGEMQPERGRPEAGQDRHVVGEYADLALDGPGRELDRLAPVDLTFRGQYLDFECRLAGQGRPISRSCPRR